MSLGEVWVALGDGGRCVKDIDWGFGKVDFRIVFGLSGRFGHTAPVRAGANLLFIDGWWL